MRRDLVNDWFDRCGVGGCLGIFSIFGTLIFLVCTFFIKFFLLSSKFSFSFCFFCSSSFSSLFVPFLKLGIDFARFGDFLQR